MARKALTADELLMLVCLQRRYLSLLATAQLAYKAGHKKEFAMLLPIAKRLLKEIDVRFAKIPKSQLDKAKDSDLSWLLTTP